MEVCELRWFWMSWRQPAFHWEINSQLSRNFNCLKSKLAAASSNRIIPGKTDPYWFIVKVGLMTVKIHLQTWGHSFKGLYGSWSQQFYIWIRNSHRYLGDHRYRRSNQTSNNALKPLTTHKMVHNLPPHTCIPDFSWCKLLLEGLTMGTYISLRLKYFFTLLQRLDLFPFTQPINELLIQFIKGFALEETGEGDCIDGSTIKGDFWAFRKGVRSSAQASS